MRGVSAPSNLRNLEPMIRERTGNVLDSLPEGETFDWVDTVSIELTTLMLATLFDFPMEDRRMLTRWSDIVFAVPEPGGIVESQQQKFEEIVECLHYFEGLWDQRRGVDGSDLVSLLANGEATRDMAAVDHLGNLLLLIVGGNDTTRNTMSASVYGLNKYPDQYDKLLADHGLVQNLVPEIIRWQTPLPYMRRTANRDCEIRDKQILKGDQILMWYLSANRDEDVRRRGGDRPRAPQRRPSPVVRVRHPLLHGQPTRRAAAPARCCGRRSSSGSPASRSRRNRGARSRRSCTGTRASRSP